MDVSLGWGGKIVQFTLRHARALEMRRATNSGEHVSTLQSIKRHLADLRSYLKSKLVQSAYIRGQLGLICDECVS